MGDEQTREVHCGGAGHEPVLSGHREEEFQRHIQPAVSNVNTLHVCV